MPRSTKLTFSAANELVMNYLTSEGHVEAARQFARESGVEREFVFVVFFPALFHNYANTADVPLEDVERRMRVRDAILSGDIATAVALVGSCLDVKVRASKQVSKRTLSLIAVEQAVETQQLLFDLHLQRLLELIRVGDVTAALDCARDECVPRSSVADLDQLESSMALLAFVPGAVPPPLQPLLDVARRNAVWQRASTILSQSTSSRVVHQLRRVAHDEQSMARAHCVHPTLDDLLLGDLGFSLTESDATTTKIITISPMTHSITTTTSTTTTSTISTTTTASVTAVALTALERRLLTR